MRNAGGRAPGVRQPLRSTAQGLLDGPPGHTRARYCRNSAEAASSVAALVPSSVELAASAAPSALAPERASSAAEALKGVEPMLARPMRAELMLPLSFSTTAATPTIAQSCDRRAIL